MKTILFGILKAYCVAAVFGGACVALSVLAPLFAGAYAFRWVRKAGDFLKERTARVLPARCVRRLAALATLAAYPLLFPVFAVLSYLTEARTDLRTLWSILKPAPAPAPVPAE